MSLRAEVFTVSYATDVGNLPSPIKWGHLSKRQVLGHVSSERFPRWMGAKAVRNSAVISFHSHWQTSVKSSELKRQAWWQGFNSRVK